MPKKVTIKSEQAEQQKAACDLIISRAAEMMVGEVGASVPMMLDRMLTYASAQACCIDGSASTASLFRTMALRIEAGLFHHITGEGDSKVSRH